MLVLLCIVGTSLSARRQQAIADNLHLTCLQGTQAFHQVAEAEEGPQQSIRTLSASPNDDGHVCRQKVKVKFPTATLPADVVAQIHNHVAGTSLIKAIRSLHILRPAYYCFLFRYTPF